MTINCTHEINMVLSSIEARVNAGANGERERRKMAEGKKITVAEARDILRISPANMARLIKAGTLKTEPSPIDGRVKLVLLADVEALARASGREIEEGKEAAAA